MRQLNPDAAWCPRAIGINDNDLPYFRLVRRQYVVFESFQPPGESPANHCGPGSWRTVVFMCAWRARLMRSAIVRHPA